MTIIAISGKKGSGKTTVRDHLLKVFAGARPFSFAGAIKRLCVDVMGLRPEQVYGSDADKNTPTRYLWESLPHYQAIVARLRTEATERCAHEYQGCDEAAWQELVRRAESVTFPAGPMTARQVMQEVGTMGRMMHEDLWAEACLRDIAASGAAVAVIDDLRYENELRLVQGAGGVVVRLTRFTTGHDPHSSETALDPKAFDWSRFNAVVDNSDCDIAASCARTVDALAGLGLSA